MLKLSGRSSTSGVGPCCLAGQSRKGCRSSSKNIQRRAPRPLYSPHTIRMQLASWPSPLAHRHPQCTRSPLCPTSSNIIEDHNFNSKWETWRSRNVRGSLTPSSDSDHPRAPPFATYSPIVPIAYRPFATLQSPIVRDNIFKTQSGRIHLSGSRHSRILVCRLRRLRVASVAWKIERSVSRSYEKCVTLTTFWCN